MTKLLERAIAKVRTLSEDDQDAIALAILSMADTDAPEYAIDDATRAAILEGLEQARRVRAGRGNRSALEAPWSMRVRFTKRARDDLVAILNYLDERRSPQRARNVSVRSARLSN